MPKITSEVILSQEFDGSIPSKYRRLNYQSLLDLYYAKYSGLTWDYFIENCVEFTVKVSPFETL